MNVLAQTYYVIEWKYEDPAEYWTRLGESFFEHEGFAGLPKIRDDIWSRTRENDYIEGDDNGVNFPDWSFALRDVAVTTLTELANLKLRSVQLRILRVAALLHISEEATNGTTG